MVPGLIALLQALTLGVSGPASSPELMPLHLAAAEGGFTREGLAVTLMPTRGPVEAAELLARGQADLVATSLWAVLHFGPRSAPQAPRLVVALTAAPPVVLLASTATLAPVETVRDLAGRRVAAAAPGTAEQAWLAALLRAVGIPLSRVELLSLGPAGAADAMRRGEVDAALLDEPYASFLLEEARARILADLRSPAAVERALGFPTVHMAVFARADRPPSALVRQAFVRAVLAAEQRVADAAAPALRVRLPRAVVGSEAAFARRLATARTLYLPGGLVTPAQLRRTLELLRAHRPLPMATERLRAEDLLALMPLSPAPGAPGR
jgi:ABC-type nitrate/sulfonate/bicarbonate transport system substrate-binding protein